MMTTTGGHNEAMERCVAEVERRFTWVGLRTRLVTALCEEVADEYCGEIRMRPDPWEPNSRGYFADDRGDERPAAALAAFQGNPLFDGEGETGPLGEDEADELLAGLALVGFLDADAIERRTRGGVRPSTEVGELVAALGEGSLSARLGWLARLGVGAPLMAQGVFAPLGSGMFGGLDELRREYLVPRTAAWEWAERLTARPMRALFSPGLADLAPWRKPRELGWDDGELVASFLRDLVLLASVRAAQDELDFELLAYERDGREYTETERRLRLDTYSRRLEAARAERAERMARATSPLALARLVRDHDLSAMEVEIVVVLAGLELLGDDAELAFEAARRHAKAPRLERTGTVGGLSALLAHERGARMAVRELLSPTGKLARAGLIETSEAFVRDTDLIDPGSFVTATPHLLAVLSGVEGLVGLRSD